ncbi:unnamed protein product [Pseudo-nitzschia multistriata]|uniref:PAS domain-containing protein n=1 Tax=Pseudo-nitzschia multistriata TaxID=183589 RepID=A0A448ZBI3_9STRA|nr:unnamed protein product [Pseudo-nitzschia multistriata]
MIAGIGSVATGVFKTNIDQKEQLELLVRERTQVIHFKTKELRRINVAFEACETAIAITDSSRVVIWANNAFEKLAKRTTTVQPSLGEQSRVSATSDTDALNETCSSVGRQLTDVIVLNDSTNETKLRGAFDFLSPRHDEINIIGDDCTNSSRGKSDYRLEVTPFVDYDEGTKTISNDNDNNLFLVAFHDITADRARKQAENMAREEALLSKAMKESMVTLTVRISVLEFFLNVSFFHSNSDLKLTSTSFSTNLVRHLLSMNYEHHYKG